MKTYWGQQHCGKVSEENRNICKDMSEKSEMLENALKSNILQTSCFYSFDEWMGVNLEKFFFFLHSSQDSFIYIKADSFWNGGGKWSSQGIWTCSNQLRIEVYNKREYIQWTHL